MDDVPLSLVDVIDDCPDWRENNPDLATKIEHAAFTTLQTEGRAGAVTILLSNADHVQELNVRFRGKDSPTNVLSFPSGEDRLQQAEALDPQPLGDIILSFETVIQEATDQKKSLSDHTIHLVVHGLLHILGYDHQNESDTAIMTNREINILAQINIADPYAGCFEHSPDVSSRG